ncbi:beta-lactamase family protein [Streptomyces sp. NBC_00452]|uniref:serine hydrolase domain-containing protein n=1 Tax=Streptomyces sp. NBC_00452 TaxID=2975746 RepID=UPI0022577A9D|nr:serine hydrolase domain-containing protein [Streptomyces sp. NBC_00452]MCX5060061.1 beta-lactamase family protein [Streptomyces sp. NBC_00452]
MPLRSAPARSFRLRSQLRATCVVAVCVTALGQAPASTAAAPAPRDADLRDQLEQLVHAPGGPPGVIAVLRRDGRSEVVSAGVADLATGRRPSPDDHMRIASTAKAFSGAVALSLVDRHALRLDETLGERLPQLPSAWHQVTLRQLLNHTSGLPDFTESAEFLSILAADPHHHFDSRHLLDFVADRPLNFPPGTEYRYSNADNIAVALMAEAATRTPYEQLLRTLVYRPLKLRNTSLPQDWRIPAPYLHGYDVTPPEPPEDVSEALSASGSWASGGIISTPADMTRFIGGYAGGALYGRNVVREQRRWIEGASEPAGPGANMAGLAIFRYATRCGVVLGHTGNFPGYTQLIAATPDGRRSLTFSVTTQINQEMKPDLLSRLRSVQENFVCALLNRSGH